MDIDHKWKAHLRKASRKPKCTLCGHPVPALQTVPPDSQDSQNASLELVRAAFEKHLVDSHAELLDEEATPEGKAAWIHSQWEAVISLGDRDGGLKPSISSPLPRTAAAGESVQPNHPPRPSSRRKPVGPDQSAIVPDDWPSEGPTPTRSKARAVATPPGIGMDEFDRGSYQRGKLWTGDDASAAPRPRPYDKSNVASYQQRQRPHSGSVSKPHRQPHAPSARTSAHAPPPVDDEPTEMIKEPETRPISQEQLVAEVKGIYAGLVMVESKCIEVDNNQSSQNDASGKLNSSQSGTPTKLNNDQWQALIALHRTLLHEHHDFFLASQHPSASPALRRLAAKYAMPARMWRHGIHSFLELLRHRLPASLDHMLTFIYMAYSMMALLYETVPAFEDTWIECLGDLGRYRMAIEDDDIRDREVWTAVSRHWYSRASDKAPTTGRLYHHLAILARPNAQQQLYYYTKSLCVEMPFPSARESIMTLFEPIMSHTSNQQQIRLPPAELYYVRTHGILFSGKQEEELEPSMGRFLELLDNHIGRSTRRWIEPGYHIGISNICALIGYGDETNPIAQALKVTRPSDESSDQPMPDSETPAPSPSVSASKQFPSTRKLFIATYDVVCRRFGDHNILAFVHVTLVLIHHLTFFPEAMGQVAPHFPWKLTALMLNTLIGSSSSQNVSQALARFLESGEPFPGWKEKQEEEKQNNAEGAEPGEPRPGAPKKRPLPEDFALRGFPFVENYFPDGWFVTEEKIDDDDKSFELLSMIEERKERVVWLGRRIAEKDGKWLRFDKENRRFGVHPDYEVELDLEMPTPATPGESIDYGELPDAGAVA